MRLSFGTQLALVMMAMGSDAERIEIHVGKPVDNPVDKGSNPRVGKGGGDRRKCWKGKRQR